MKKIFLFSFILFFFSNSFTQNSIEKAQLSTGADLLISENLDLIKGKRLGIVTNHTAVLSNGVHLVDSLFNIEDVKITALFGPEHGIRGNAPAGEIIEHGKDIKTGIPAFSLYGKDRKPTKEMLNGVDILIFDIQDVGARFYTYISTLFYTVQAAAENNIPVIILDRPNPINGVSVDGPVRKEDLVSFVGIAPIPVMHGMTIGELAEYYSGEGLIGDIKPDLKIIKMKNWDRSNYFDDYDLVWNVPSPNIPNLEAAIVYPGTCLIEGINASEGRGTLNPFLTIGAPYVNPDELINELAALGIAGMELSPIEFTPEEIQGMVLNPKHKGTLCKGISIRVIDRKEFEPVKFGIKLVYALHKLYPEQFEFRKDSFDRLAGDRDIRNKIERGEEPGQIITSWKNELNDFLTIRKKYLLY